MSMKIITGSTGTAHVTSNNDGEFNQEIFGQGSFVFENGNQLSATLVDNNTIVIADGDLLLNGRHALIEPNTNETVSISTGAVGYNRNDLIVARYSLDSSTGHESITLTVIKGTESSGTATDPEYNTGDIRTGARVVDFPLYRVVIEGISITEVKKLFSVKNNLVNQIEENSKDISLINSSLTNLTTTVNNKADKSALGTQVTYSLSGTTLTITTK